MKKINPGLSDSTLLKKNLLKLGDKNEAVRPAGRSFKTRCARNMWLFLDGKPSVPDAEIESAAKKSPSQTRKKERKKSLQDAVKIPHRHARD